MTDVSPLVHLWDVGYRLSRKRWLVEAMSFDLDGELLAIVGPNGAGKTTLLRILAGLMTPSCGQYLLAGKAIGALSARERAQQIAYLPQQSVCHWPMPVHHVVALGLIPYDHGWGFRVSMQQARQVDAVMGQLDIRHLADRRVDRLSGGELQRVMLARALVGQPRLLLLDEPVASLDITHQMQLMEALRGYVADGMTIIAIMHDILLAARYADAVLLMQEGKKVTLNSPLQALSPEHLALVYGVQMADALPDWPFHLKTSP